VVSPFVVGYLMVNYQLPGVVWLMIGLVVIQIIAVYFWVLSRRDARSKDSIPKSLRRAQPQSAAQIGGRSHEDRDWQ
jgi:hypothetical protein